MPTYAEQHPHQRGFLVKNCRNAFDFDGSATLEFIHLGQGVVHLGLGR